MKADKLLNYLVLLSSIAIFVVVSLEVIPSRQIIGYDFVLQFQFVICMVFLVDFVVRYAKSDRKRHFFINNLIYLLVAIPYTNIIHWLDLEVNSSTALFLRVIPIIRGGYGLWILMIYISKSPIAGLFVAYLLSLVTLVYFSSLLFYAFERGENSMVSTFPDALWWALMDVTTVGSNIYAQTTVGKWLSVILASSGMMMFPIFTVYITSRYGEIYKKGRRR